MWLNLPLVAICEPTDFGPQHIAVRHPQGILDGAGIRPQIEVLREFEAEYPDEAGQWYTAPVEGDVLDLADAYIKRDLKISTDLVARLKRAWVLPP